MCTSKLSNKIQFTNAAKCNTKFTAITLPAEPESIRIFPCGFFFPLNWLKPFSSLIHITKLLSHALAPICQFFILTDTAFYRQYSNFFLWSEDFLRGGVGSSLVITHVVCVNHLPNVYALTLLYFLSQYQLHSRICKSRFFQCLRFGFIFSKNTKYFCL